jgi:hypothetical protein
LAGTVTTAPSSVAKTPGPTIAAAQNTSSQAAQDRALSILRQVTLQEKISMMHGVGNPNCSYFVPPTNRVCIPTLGCGRAMRSAYQQYERAKQFGTVVGKEIQLTGQNVSPGPVLGLARVPQ